ncbi:MAG TPA: GNAT family N-acetyltransferase [Candidatus Ozemobacteraceae bacterium]|nr:GNAT family N-acetyltransferase [Candidatus Ozemobacteraceae bacterium]HQG29776.1 GNAT family N-acetyltransferase [Candidatus Ozemobacteraceae bacterium]
MPVDKLRSRIDLREAVSPKDLETVFEIRRRVFVDEQKVPEEHERDATDDRSVHLLAVLDGVPVAAARLFVDAMDARTAWIGRLAVLPESRRTGVATTIIRYFIDWSCRHQMHRIRLHAQEYVRGLYRKLGFEECGGMFLEENIPHVEMILRLS